MSKGVFATWAQRYRQLGYWPRPVRPGTKECRVKQWQRPDHEIPAEALQLWETKYRDHGLGLNMGSPFPDGTRLAGLDIDRDEYLPLARALLSDPPCGRVGSKGAVFFVRVRGAGKSIDFRVKGEKDQTIRVGEFLFLRRFCVLPPTIHPSTNEPYRWIGTPLHEIDFTKLPLIEI